MYKNIIFALSLLSSLAFTEAGVIKILCIDDNGNNIPCEQIAGNTDIWNSWWNNNTSNKKYMNNVNVNNSNPVISNAVNTNTNTNTNANSGKTNDANSLFNSWMNNYLRNWLNSSNSNRGNSLNNNSAKNNNQQINRPIQVITTKTIPSVATSTAAATQPTTANPSNGGFSISKLPKQEFTMTDFQGCTQEQAQKLRVLIEDIKTYRAAGKYIVDNQSEDEMYNKIFLKYFKDNNVLSSVKKVFDNLNNMSTAKAYCETSANDVCNQNTLAWTYLNSREFHVCPIFFTRAMHGTIEKHTSEAASIVLHEMTHCYGTRDHAYGERDIEYLNASQAANNADTYRLYAMRAIYYLNEKNGGMKKRELDDILNDSIDFRAEPFEDKVIIRINDENTEGNTQEIAEETTNLSKRSDDDFLNESIDFRSVPLTDTVLVRPEDVAGNNLNKRSDDDFLNESIDFRSVPLTDTVLVRPEDVEETNLSKRSDDDFLNESIDFRSEPLTDTVLIRPEDDAGNNLN
eukprot:jgi/Orpsp1_1/1188204/evm.model.d7180000063202.1